MEQIQTAVDFIETRLYEPLDAASIAAAVGLSVSRLHRLFRAMVGESLMDYVRSRRLASAAYALVTRRDSVLDVALAHGFESHETFTRAFQRRFGDSPSAFRKDCARSWRMPLKPRIDRDYLDHLYRGIDLEPVVRHLPEQRAIGLDTCFFGFNHPRADVFERIPPLWSEVLQAARPQRRLLGMVECPDCLGGGEQSRYTAACLSEDDAPPPGWRTYRIPAGRYACFEHRGAPQTYPDSFLYMYAVWLPQSGEDWQARPELELYPADYFSGAARAVTLCVPLV